MGINPKIGITGLPRSGKSAVLQKVVDMITEEGGGARTVSYTHLTLPTIYSV